MSSDSSGDPLERRSRGGWSLLRQLVPGRRERRRAAEAEAPDAIEPEVQLVLPGLGDA